MKQILAPLHPATITTGTMYASPSNLVGAWASAENQGSQPWCASGTFRNLTIKLSAAPGVGTSRTFAVRIAGSTSALTVTISDNATTATLTGTDVSVTAFDAVAIIHTNSGSVASSTVSMSLEFESTTAGQSCYGTCNASAVSTAAASYNGVFAGTTPWATSVSNNIENVIPTAGSITAAALLLSTATGAGKSRTLTIYLNSVIQDGSAGSVDTRLTISHASNVTANATFSLPVVAGDRIYVEHTSASSPTSSRVSYGYRFTATVDGQSVLCGSSSATLSAVSTNYGVPTLASNLVGTTETAQEVIGGFTTYTLSKLYWALSAAPGAAKSYTASLREDVASPSGTLSSQITGTGTPATGNDTTNALVVTSVDTWTMRFVPASTPTAGIAAWGLVQVIGGTTGGGKPKPPKGKGLYGPTLVVAWDTVNYFGAS